MFSSLNCGFQDQRKTDVDMSASMLEKQRVDETFFIEDLVMARVLPVVTEVNFHNVDGDGRNYVESEIITETMRNRLMPFKNSLGRGQDVFA